MGFGKDEDDMQAEAKKFRDASFSPPILFYSLFKN
jgi:hypothetical protein